MKCIDEGYVVMKNHKDYYTANRGIFKTKRNAQKHCDLFNRIYHENNKVVKVKLMVVEEE